MAYFFAKPQIYDDTIMKKTILFLLLVFLSTISFNSYAQNRKKAQKAFEAAVDNFRAGKDNEAAELLKKSIEADSTFINPYLGIAELYYNAQDKELRQNAFWYYKKVVDLDKNFDINSHLRLADFYIQVYDTINAREEYEYYLLKANPQRDSLNIREAEKGLEGVEFVTWALQNPVPFQPMDMGDNINVSEHNYFPTLTADEQTFIFTSRKNEDG